MKNLLACHLQKILLIASGWPFWEWGMVPVVCYCERNYFYSVTAEETSSPGTDCNLPSPTLSYWRVQKPFYRYAHILLVEKSGFFSGVFSNYFNFFSWVCKEPIASVIILAIKIFFHVQKLQEAASWVWHSIGNDNADISCFFPRSSALNVTSLVRMGCLPQLLPKPSCLIFYPLPEQAVHNTITLIHASKKRKIAWSQMIFATTGLFIPCIMSIFIQFSLPWPFWL